MEVKDEAQFVVMAEILPRNERTEAILAQRAAENAAKHEKAEQVSHFLDHVHYKWVGLNIKKGWQTVS